MTKTPIKKLAESCRARLNFKLHFEKNIFLRIFPVLLIFAFSAHILCPTPCLAESYFRKEAIGTTTADFLNLPVGARAIGMGGAYTAISEEASGIYWNPAGLVQIPKLSVTFMRADYIADINYQYIAYAQRLTNDSTIGASFFVTDIGSLDERDIYGTKTGQFTPKDQVISLSYSKAILEFSDKEKDVSVGITAKYIKSKIVKKDNSFAGDIGVMTYNFTTLPYRLGVMLTNFGQGLRYDKESNALPMTLRLGGSLSPFKNLLISVEAVLPKNNKINYLLGCELSTQPNELTKLSIRGGINNQLIRDDLSGFNLGLGATLHFFTLDYAYTPLGDLGKTHRISITLDFPFRSPIFERRDRSIFTRMDKIGFK